MASIVKIVGVLSYGFVLCAALAPGALALAADDMNADQTERKGTQSMGKGEQAKIKEDDMRTDQNERKGGQTGMTGEEDKTKRVDNAGKPDKTKEVKQDEMGKINK